MILVHYKCIIIGNYFLYLHYNNKIKPQNNQ